MTHFQTFLDFFLLIDKGPVYLLGGRLAISIFRDSLH